MDKFFDTILANGFTSKGAIFICIGAALISGFVFSVLASLKIKASRSFYIGAAILPAVVAVVVSFVNSNLGAGIAIAGAFSLVRFRSAQGSTQEIAVIFIVMASGVAFGAGYVAIGALFLLVMAGVLILLNSLNVWERKSAKSVRWVRITIPEDLNYTHVFDDIFEKYTSSFVLEKAKTTNMGSMFKLAYTVVFKNPDSEKEFVDELRCRNGNLEVSVEIPTQDDTKL